MEISLVDERHIDEYQMNRYIIPSSGVFVKWFFDSFDRFTT